MKPFKIRVESESHSREIQEWLFSKGADWPDGKKTFFGTNAGLLRISRRPRDGALLIGISGYPEFYLSELPEKWFYDGQLQDRPPVISLTYRQLIEAQLRGERVQVFNSKLLGWDDYPTMVSCNQSNLNSPVKRYRIKPKPRRCNGVELDECLTEAPELGTNYYYPDPMHVDYYNSKPWADDADDIYWLELGFVYGSSESAAKHGHAMGITMEG